MCEKRVTIATVAIYEYIFVVNNVAVFNHYHIGYFWPSYNMSKCVCGATTKNKLKYTEKHNLLLWKPKNGQHRGRYDIFNHSYVSKLFKNVLFVHVQRMNINHKSITQLILSLF